MQQLLLVISMVIVDINESRYSFNGHLATPKNQISNFGLHDIVGNVSEWCWDWYYDSWYSDSESRVRDTKGPIRNLFPLLSSKQMSILESPEVETLG